MSNLTEGEKEKVKALVVGVCDAWQKEHQGRPLVEFAASAGVPYTGGLLRWRSGRHAPSARYLIRLLDAGGVVDRLAEVGQSVNSEPTAQDPLAELKGAVDATLALAEKIDGRLAAVEQRLGQEDSPPVAAVRGRPRKGTGP